MISFTLHCEPPKHTAQGSSTILKNFKTGKFFIGKKSNSNAVRAKNELIALLLPHQPQKPLEGALKLEIDLFFSWRKSEPKKNRQFGLLPMYVKPDLDNWCKQFNDCLTRLAFYHDDAQIAVLNVSKYWSDEPKIVVKISVL